MQSQIALPSHSKQGPAKPHMPRRASFDIPDRFELGEDAEKDVSAPKSKRGQYLNQSFLSLIANVGSNASFETHLGLEASAVLPGTGQEALGHRSRMDSNSEDDPTATASLAHPAGYRPGRRLHPHPIAQSTPRLRKHHHTDLHPVEETMSTSQILQPRDSPYVNEEEEKEIEPRSEHSSIAINSEQARTASPPARSELDVSGSIWSGASNNPSGELAEKIAQIYGFPEPEEILSDYPCWLLQSVLLQGHLYVTPRHICFYAYLPRRTGVVAKSGFLSKRGRQNPKYRRYWFTLKGSVLSYYSNPSNLYFPSGHIDLRSGISAQVDSPKEGKDAAGFSITASNRIHRFHADSAANATEWVKHLQKAIFRSHNDSDSVKISLPIDNILDVEDNPVLDFADTFRIRIIDNDETYAVDEYFFSFFNHSGQDALASVRTAVVRNARDPARPTAKPFADAAPTVVDAASAPKDEVQPSEYSNLDHTEMSKPLEAKTSQVSSTKVASPTQGPEDASGQKGAEGIAKRASRHQSGLESLDGPSLSSSSGYASDSSIEEHSMDMTTISASQILQRSDVFHQPSMRFGIGDPRRVQHSQVSEQRERRAPVKVAEPSKEQDQGKIQPSKGATETESSTQNPSLFAAKLRETLHPSSSSTTLQELFKAGSYPLQKASGIAGLLRAHSSRVGSALASESKTYYEKVTNMWAGKTQHFDDLEALAAGETGTDGEDDETKGSHGDRFRSYFALPASEKLQATYHGYLTRAVPVFGKIYVGERKLCFRSLLPGTRTKMILPLKDIETIDKENGFRFGYSGLVIVVRGHEELFLEFAQAEARDDLDLTLLQSLQNARRLQETRVLDPEEKHEVDVAKTEFEQLEQARRNGPRDRDSIFQSIALENEPEVPPIIFDDPLASIIDFKPPKSLRITCLTIGSRGDVQPYIALCKGLLAEGHRPCIATHAEFEPWIRYHGIDFAPVAGDPAEIMRLCVEHDMFTVSFFREASSKFRGWIDDLLRSSWRACQGSDLLIESPSAMCGIHIAEALQIPYFRAFTMLWTRTRAYPHAFAVPSQKLGGNYNLLSYVMFDNVFWQAVAGQINRWRAKALGLPATNLDKMQTSSVPFLYNFSPAVVAPPLDFSPWVHVTGYWFLDEGSDYTPSVELAAFIAKARTDGKKIVYVGFGSIVVDDPAALTQTVVDSVVKADVRCILSKGWSDRLEKRVATAPEFPLPPEIFQIKSAPHDWLFGQIDAAAHHGGAGTTGASLRAGIPTVVKPFFGDQFFFGSRVEDLGVGRCLKKINTSVFARALWEVTNNQRIINKAKLLGEQIRSESGVNNAIQRIYRDLEYAKSLIKRHKKTVEPDIEETAEDWTLVGEDSDSDTARRSMEMGP